METIAIGGIMHESNTFSSIPTDRVAFESGQLERVYWREPR